MSNCLGNLGGLHAAVEREVEIVRQFDRLIARDQGRESDDTAIARRKARTLPEITKQNALGILFKSGCDGTNVFWRNHGLYSFD